MPRLKANGIELEYDTLGTGDPVVLVMGVGAQMIVWPEGFCEELAARGFQVIRFDNRDVGLSTHLDHTGVPNVLQAIARGLIGLPIEAPYTLSDMASDVAGLIQGLGFESAHVFGMSMGGMIAQTVAAEHPRRVRSLVSFASGILADAFTDHARATR